MAMLWLILFLAIPGLQLVQGLPVNPTPQAYQHEASGTGIGIWGSESGLYAGFPALALVITAVGLIFGCTWCYRHKDCKPNEGADNQLFTASVTHLHDVRRSQPPDSGFSEPANNNISEDNNNGPISLREMQNIANNNAAAYIVSENEERNRISRESVVEFEPLPAEIRVIDPLERCADWFAGEDFPRNQLQYLREIGRGWFGRVVEGDIENGPSTITVAVKILNQNATLEDKARFLDEARLYRDMNHENVLGFVAKCLQEDPWILLFELCSMDLQQFLVVNRPKMAILNERGVPLQLMCDVTSALAHVHSRGYLYGNLRSSNVLVRGVDNPRAVLGQYANSEPLQYYSTSTDVWSLGFLIWEVCTWGAAPPADRLPPPPDLPCPYRDHLYQVMQLCWNSTPEARPTAAQVHALINHLHFTHTHPDDNAKDDGYASSDFEERWQRLKPNTIPKVDEHVAIIHAPSTSMTSQFTGSDQDFDNAPTIQDSLSVEMDTAVSRSSSIMSDKDPLSVQIKSESLTNLHGSLEDVRNIYLTHNETPAMECHQGNINLEDIKEKERDRSDSSVDPWLKDIITSSTDDVSYYKDVSDVIKNLDNILNSEKTSSSESSHQASPSRDNLSLECKKDYPMQTSMVKSPGISNFQNILEMGFEYNSESTEPCDEDEGDRDTLGTLSHSFERHSDSLSQQTLENITPETPIKDMDIHSNIETEKNADNFSVMNIKELNSELPKESRVDSSDSKIPKLKELCIAFVPSVSHTIEQVILKQDCQTSYDNVTKLRAGSTETKSIGINEDFISNEITYTEKQNVSINESNDFKREKRDSLNLDDRSSSVLQDTVLRNTTPIDTLVSKNVITDIGEVDTLRNYSSMEETLELENEEENVENTLCYTDKPAQLKNSNTGLPTKSEKLSKERDYSLPVSIDSDVLSENENKVDFQQMTLLESNKIKPNINHDILFTETLPENNFKSDILLSLDVNTPQLIPSHISTSCEISDSGLTNTVAEAIDNKNNVEKNATYVVEGNNSLIADCRPIIVDDLKVHATNEFNKGNVNIENNESRSESTKEIATSQYKVELDEIVMCKNVEKGSDLKTLNSENYAESLQSKNDGLIDSKCDSLLGNMHVLDSIVNHIEIIKEQPETVQNDANVDSTTNTINLLDINIDHSNSIVDTLSFNECLKPEEVQSSKDNILSNFQVNESNTEDATGKVNEQTESLFNGKNEAVSEMLSDSTVYMDLINDKNSKILKDTNVDNSYRYAVQSCLETSDSENPCTLLLKNESTMYLDLPSIIKETDDFLQSEKHVSNQSIQFNNQVCTSTPKGSEDSSAEGEIVKDAEHDLGILLSETKVPDYGPGVTLTKLEQKRVPDNISPFESPSKSHHTDTYDENSSVVLGPFENCTLDLYRGVKSISEIADLPKDELLAFSSNFSEMNLETPSPLRDGNFLNEVPDIVPDEMHFDEIVTMSETKPESHTANNTDETEDQSTTERRVSPLTPPNSPGNFLASTSQQKYLVDIDISSNADSSNSTYQDVIDLNQIDLQMTAKLAIAENENNMNIEYSGPLNEVGLLSQDILLDLDSTPELYLAGNGGLVEDVKEGFAIDEERMKELRNELELKLPLAQVAGIEPAVTEAEWTDLPLPPELVLTYGALSPIAEETRLQLCAYENDDHWNSSVRTESSASYPEPCNNSTDEVTDLPTGANSGQHQSHDHSTYTIQSKEPSVNHTFTVQKEIPSSKELTMSADSLNASPLKKIEDVQSPIDDKTYVKNDDDKESNCERLSQVSPFLLSPTTDSSVPENSDVAAGPSTFSKTTVPTDAKSSKPSETQCLSKATSIDSWCSNDTLYNVEENFDDLAMDPDIPLDFEAQQDKDKSESDDTLTHNDDEKEVSHCSTYIIHDSKSEIIETFSPDSITANDNNTYTKAKTEVGGATSPVVTKSELNDSAKNSRTKDLAYGTLISGLQSYSNCTTELVSGIEDVWKIPQPEMVRRSPQGNEVKITPPKDIEKKDISECENGSPKLELEPLVKKMDSVDLTFLGDHSVEDSKNVTSQKCEEVLTEVSDCPNTNFKNFTLTATSTPIITIQDSEDVEGIPLDLPEVKLNVSDISNPSGSQAFLQSDDWPQESCSIVKDYRDGAEVLLAADKRTLQQNDSSTDKTLMYSDFENSAVTKPQDVSLKGISHRCSQSLESGINSEEFTHFESLIKKYPQDLTSFINASALLLKSERQSGEIIMGNGSNADGEQINESLEANTEPESLVFVSSNYTNLFESHPLEHNQSLNVFVTDLDMEEETEQPHSIIITGSPLLVSKVSPNKGFDPHIKGNRKDTNSSYDSHGNFHVTKNIWHSDKNNSADEVLNGFIEESPKKVEKESPDVKDLINSSAAICNQATPSLSSHLETSIVKPNPQIKEPYGALSDEKFPELMTSNKCNGDNQMYATVNFLNETFEELMESNVDENDTAVNDLRKEDPEISTEKSLEAVTDSESTKSSINAFDGLEGRTITMEEIYKDRVDPNGIVQEEKLVTSVTDDFLQNEKKYCQLDSYFPLLSDIRFTGPATEIMSTSFTQDSPTDPTSPECEQDSKPDPAADILKEWDSDSDSHSTNSSSGEFIWKDGDGHETAVVPSTHFDHQRDSNSQPSNTGSGAADAPSSAGSGDSASGSEGDEVEFVPSSWDCRAAPSKSSLRNFQHTPDSKKRVVFKRQKYHCVYEYPREIADVDVDSPAAYLPDFSTYSEWDPSSAEDAELGYGQLFGSPNPLDLFPLRSGIAFGADYDEDFFISSSARPFESLGVMSSASQFFPGAHIKPRASPDALLQAEPEPHQACAPASLLAATPSLDFTTPDSGVEDITPGSTIDDDYSDRRAPDTETATCWRTVDSASSSESVSPSSPGGEALGGLRHTRDKLKLDLPPSPHVPSPKHNRVFNFVLDKPKRREERAEPLVMTDDTPVVAVTLAVSDDEDHPSPEPTFSTFGKPSTGKSTQSNEVAEKSPNIILTDEVEETISVEVKEEGSGRVEPVKGEGTVLDSGDEDSGIESSSKATLERNKTPNIS